jgi:integrase
VSAPLVKTRTEGVYKRGGRYVAIWRDNRGRQRSRSAATIGEAKAIRSAAQADVARGEYRTVSRMTFEDYACEWIASYRGRTARGLRDATREDYARELGIDPATWQPFEPVRGAVAYFGRRRLAEIEPRDVKRYATSVSARGVSANTVRLALAPLKALLATAVEDGLIRSNPAAGLRLTTEAARPDESDGAKVKALTEEELARLLAEVPQEWRLFVTLLAQAGLRISEALPLRWGDVDFGRRRVAIRRSLSRGRIGAPKTRHGRRDVPLTASMVRALWVARKTAGDPADDASIFVGADGKWFDRSQVFRVVRAAGKRAGVPWVGLHTLRHSAATILFRNGWNAVQVQRFLGHHSPAFTLATYVHLLPDDLPEPVFLDGLLAGGAAAGDAEEFGEDARLGRLVVEGGVDLDDDRLVAVEGADVRDRLEVDARRVG